MNPIAFISYRRKDAGFASDLLYAELTRTFGKEAVFRDIDAIPAGADYRHHLDQAVKECGVFLALISPGWIERLHDEGDFVRIETESALTRKIPVIPVYLEGIPPPESKDLPKSIQELAFRQGLYLHSNHNRDPDVRRIVGAVSRRFEEIAAESLKAEEVRLAEERLLAEAEARVQAARAADVARRARAVRKSEAAATARAVRKAEQAAKADQERLELEAKAAEVARLAEQERAAKKAHTRASLSKQQTIRARRIQAEAKAAEAKAAEAKAAEAKAAEAKAAEATVIADRLLRAEASRKATEARIAEQLSRTRQTAVSEKSHLVPAAVGPVGKPQAALALNRTASQPVSAPVHGGISAVDAPGYEQDLSGVESESKGESRAIGWFIFTVATIITIFLVFKNDIYSEEPANMSMSGVGGPDQSADTSAAEGDTMGWDGLMSDSAGSTMVDASLPHDGLCASYPSDVYDIQGEYGPTRADS